MTANDEFVPAGHGAAGRPGTAAADPMPTGPGAAPPEQPIGTQRVQYYPYDLRPGYQAGAGLGPTPYGPRPAANRPPDPPLPRLLIPATLLAGLGCAVVTPDTRPGLGMPIAATVIALMVVVGAWRTPGSVRALLTVPARVETAAWGAATLLLTWVAAVRDAEWLVALCLLTACVTGAIAVGGRLGGGLGRATLAVPLAALRAVPWLGRSAARSWRSGERDGLRLAASVLVGIGLLLVFGALLASADAVFAALVGGLLPDTVGLSATTWVIYFAIGAMAVAGAGYLLAAPPALALPPLRYTRLRTRDWAIPVGALVALFTVFVGVQFAALFGDEQHVQLTTGLTFAEYARSGFWELLWVSVLALGVILAGLRWAPPYTAVDRMVKRVLLTALAVLCLVIVASALRRMWLYQEAYGFTVLRLLVEVCELWLGLAFVLVAVAVLRLDRNGPVRQLVATAVAALLALAVLNPELFIAERNLERQHAVVGLDTEYLSELSADVVPALLQLPDSPQRRCMLAVIGGRIGTDGDEWRAANLSRAAAREAIAAFAPPHSSDSCREARGPS